jgi:hypothetical protein
MTKNPLQLDNQPTDFYDPYFVYDVVTIFDKNSQQYVVRQRATAVSFSNNGEMIIAFAVCSDHDVFSKPKARAILKNRIDSCLRTVMNQGINDGFALNNAYYFRSIEEYKSFCNLFDISASYYFTPNAIIQQQRTKSATNPNKHVKTYKLIESPRENVSYSYWHYEFITNTYARFMTCFDNATPPVAELQPTEDNIPF